MHMNRRHCLRVLMSAAALTTFSHPLTSHGAGPGVLPLSASERFLTTRKLGTGYEAVVLDAAGSILARAPLPDRGHSFAVTSNGDRCVAFGRQPGFYACFFTTDTLHAEHRIVPAANRHFFGHGAFSPDGRTFYATENDYANGHGVVGVYRLVDGRVMERIGEWSTQGIGPHEIILLNDANTLCVANGGLLTHPDYGKQALNLHDMQPSLVYLDRHTGAVLEQRMLPDRWHQLSIRHLAQDAGGAVWLGCQYLGSRIDDVPVVGRHRRGGELEMLWGPTDVRRDMQHYVGSMAVDASGQQVISSSPVGGRMVIWSAQSGQVLHHLAYPDGCGVAALGNDGFLGSSGSGDLRAIHGDESTRIARIEHTAWDNHMRRLPAPG